jgi:hypothetical protein
MLKFQPYGPSSSAAVQQVFNGQYLMLDPEGIFYMQNKQPFGADFNEYLISNSYSLDIPWLPLNFKFNLYSPNIVIPGLCGCMPLGSYPPAPSSPVPQFTQPTLG